MKIAVAGLWHLGSVTAACLADLGFDVIAYDPNETTIEQFKQNQTPIYEPGLNELLAKNTLQFTANPNDLELADLIWLTFDTPVNENDMADTECVILAIKNIVPYLKSQTTLLISSQLPVGSTRRIQDFCNTHFPHKQLQCAYSPENLRLGKAIDVFKHQERIIIGIDNTDNQLLIKQLLTVLTEQIIWMSIESAEMTKHALNAFLATSVTFINELSILCEKVGADARDVEIGLKSESRIGPKAYLTPGQAFSGGTLARDVNYLVQLGQTKQLATPLFSAILTSNQAHKQWVCRRINDTFKHLQGKTITALGLTYKANTNTLRRSEAIETCYSLHQQGANIIAYDPLLHTLPDDLKKFIDLKSSLEAALQKSDAIIITTAWPELASFDETLWLANTNKACIFDPNGYLANKFRHKENIRYFTVGSES